MSLSRGYWRADPEHSPPRDRDQIDDYVQLMAKIEHLGEEGCPLNGTAVNDLEDGIWEFKHGRRRLTYWDTPGDGTFAPKGKVDNIKSRTGPPTCDYWWYPRMDPILRLGCAWPKTQQRAPTEGIATAMSIREEDCAHDRPSADVNEIE